VFGREPGVVERDALFHEALDHVGDAEARLLVGVGRGRRGRGQLRGRGRRAGGVGRHVGLHLRGDAGQEESVPESGVEQVALVEVRPVRAVVLERLLRRVDQRRSETVADAEQGLLVADAEIGVRVLGQGDRLEERHFGQDGFLRPRGTGRVSAEGDPAAVGG